MDAKYEFTEEDKREAWEQIKRYWLGLDCESEFTGGSEAEYEFWCSVSDRAQKLEREAYEVTRDCKECGDESCMLCDSCRKKLEVICANTPL